MSKYIVAGGAGFLGANLCRKLLAGGHQVQCVDDFSTGKNRNIVELKENTNFELLNHDLTKPFFPVEADGIFNLASPASPVHYQYNPIRTLKMGTLAIYNILGIATRLDVPVLQASTSEVYGDPLEHPQKESYWGNVNPIGPRACYDEGKRLAEALCQAYKSFNGVSIRIARIFNTYGPYMDPKDGRVVSNFIMQALENKPLTIYGDGSQTRSFCFVDDLVDGLLSLMDSNYEYPINLGNPSEFTISELAQEVRKLVNPNIGIIYKPLPEDDPQKRQPDITKAKEILNWEPKIAFRQGLSKTVDWFKSLHN
tara:strand:- start:113 stop:1045 length:933 start_codon:yes stop_codon:yes gene_type:complete